MTWLWGKETDHLLNVRHLCEVVYNVQNEKQHTRGGRTRAYGEACTAKNAPIIQSLKVAQRTWALKSISHTGVASDGTGRMPDSLNELLRSPVISHLVMLKPLTKLYQRRNRHNDRLQVETRHSYAEKLTEAFNHSSPNIFFYEIRKTRVLDFFFHSSDCPALIKRKLMNQHWGPL